MGLGAWSSIGVGIGEYEEGKAKLEALEAKGRPQYQIPDEIYQNLSHAQRMALEGLPEEQKKQYVENIQAGTQLGLQASGTRQGGLAGISDLYAGQVEAYRGLLAQDVTARPERNCCWSRSTTISNKRASAIYRTASACFRAETVWYGHLAGGYAARE